MITVHVNAEFVEAARAAVPADLASEVRVRRSSGERHGFRTSGAGLSFDARQRLACAIRSALPHHDIDTGKPDAA